MTEKTVILGKTTLPQTTETFLSCLEVDLNSGSEGVQAVSGKTLDQSALGAGFITVE